MFEILFLGTSASAPSAKRGLSAQIVKHDEYRFLIDCGEGTQRQILQSGAGFKHLNRILLTHGHLDHILGLAGLLSTFMRWEAIDQLEIWGGRGTLDRVRTLLYDVVLRGAKPPMPLNLREIKPGVFFEGDDFTLSAFPVTHRGPDCFGFLFESKSRRPFLDVKATELYTWDPKSTYVRLPPYFEDLARRVGPVLQVRLSRAAEDVGSFWYTAWTVAGRPELK